LQRIFRKAISAAGPARPVAESLRVGPEGVSLACGGIAASAPWRGGGRIYLAGGGKAGRAMGEAALSVLGNRIAAGTLAVPPGSGGRAGPVRFLEAGHPVPDGGSLAAAREILSLLSGAGAGDLVIALISGGGSAMLSAPVDGVSLEEKAALSGLLLRAGADIRSLNAVRKHLSLIKGGRAALAAHPARVWALLLSDVPGDEPSVIASGPFSPDPTTYAEALAVLSRFGILRETSPAVLRYLEAGAAGKAGETPKPGDPAFKEVTCVVIGSNRTALEGAAAAAKAEGLRTIRMLPGFLSGEAGVCAKSFVAEMRVLSSSLPPGESAALIAGGETTVRVTGTGKGGRCQEFALSAAIELAGSAGVALLCGGTDGIDGPTDAAGAVADGSTCRRAKETGLSPDSLLKNNDAYAVFRALGDLVVTGPTGTNVADVAIGLVSKA
ncbi:MAG TPA: glycerate kinase, partial [Candidatus Deferrimicrobiaceae bacterium]|nr:glycerate kinase [Candidatus Deferrimicrobiaceae bacterium]